MSEHEEETPNFDEMGLSSDDLTFAEPGAEAAAEAEPAAEGAGEEASVASFDLDQDAEVAMAADEHTTAEEERPEAPEEEGEPKKSLGMLFHVQWIVALLACVAVGLAFHFGHVPYEICHTSYAIAMIVLLAVTWMTRRLWATFAVTALYTVLLAGALAALMTSVYWLSLELSMYNWDLTAKLGKKAQATADAAFNISPAAKAAASVPSAKAPAPQQSKSPAPQQPKTPAPPQAKKGK